MWEYDCRIRYEITDTVIFQLQLRMWQGTHIMGAVN